MSQLELTTIPVNSPAVKGRQSRFPGALAADTVIASCLLAGWLIGATTSARAQDRIHYGPALPRVAQAWNPHPTIVLVGSIDKLNSQSIEYRDAAGKSRKLASDRIERIEVQWDTEAAAAAHARFVERKYAEVLRNNAQVLRSDKAAQWQLVILLSEIVESFDALGKPESAGKYFLLLTQQSPPDYLLATIPLNWTSREASPAMLDAAQGWISDQDPWANLLGASWLLLTDSDQLAKETLKKLQAGPNQTISQLAAAQLWRAVPPPETEKRITKWFEARDSLSLPLQLGPTEFLADRLARIDRRPLAVGQWLLIAAQHEHHPHRAAQALEAASQCLERTQSEPSATEAAHLKAWRDELLP